MKAHKRIIILTFWLSVIFAIATLVLYILGIKSTDAIIDKWFNICLSFTAGLIVPCIIEIGNYTSVKHKLYEKLFSECSSFYNILIRERTDMMAIMDMIDSQQGIEEIKKVVDNLNILNDNYIQKIEQFTKHTDFSFVSSSDKKVKGQRVLAVCNAVNCINKLSYLISQHIIISQYLILNKNINSTYIECFNTLQSICNIKSELNNCVWKMEQTHKFDIKWDKSMLLSYAQQEDSIINNRFANYKNMANRRFQTNQAASFVNDFANQFPNMQQNNNPETNKIKTIKTKNKKQGKK